MCVPGLRRMFMWCVFPPTYSKGRLVLPVFVTFRIKLLASMRSLWFASYIYAWHYCFTCVPLLAVVRVPISHIITVKEVLRLLHCFDERILVNMMDQSSCSPTAILLYT